MATAGDEVQHTGLSVGVLGASGEVGRRVVELLLDREEITTLITFSRRTSSPTSKSCTRLSHRRIDYADEASLIAGFSGIHTLIFPGSDGLPAEMIQHHHNVLKAATQCSVRRLIYLSSLDVTPSSPFPYAAAHSETEQLLKAIPPSINVFVLRASVFIEFFTPVFIQPVLFDGVLRLPAAAGRVSFVSKDDIAASLAEAIFVPTSENRLYRLTGLEALDMHEVTRQVGKVLGKHLRYEAISKEAYRAILIEQGERPYLIEAFSTMFADSISGGCFEHVSSDVYRLTKRQPRRFRDCISESIADCEGT